MLNWPGQNEAAGRPSRGSTLIVMLSAVSCRLSTTRKSRGSIPSDATVGEAVSSSALASIHVQHLQSGRLHALDQHRHETFHQVPAELGVLLALGAHADGVESNGARPLQRPGIERPPERRNKPRGAEDLARSDSLERDHRAFATREFERDLAFAKQIKVGGFSALAEDVFAGLKHGVSGAAANQTTERAGKLAKKRMLPENPVEILHHRQLTASGRRRGSP